ncbi:MAG: response regulator [Desulfobacterales bacterium]|jgi:DNA-binding NtrC family response regulator|nr:response regulator [Desulfobacterales bacterium]
MKIRILLVDDEKEYVETLAERLRNRGFHVTEAFSGSEAVEKLKGYNFDVTVLDVKMPGMSGIETLDEIKKLKPLTEVLMLTGHGTIETAIEGMKKGAYDYLLKPCKMDLLLEKINGAYERKSEHEERIRKAMVDKLSTSPMSVFEK